MKRHFSSIFIILLTVSLADAQMWDGRDTLYGNEWIRYGRPYFKIPVAEDGIYRINAGVLQAAGLPVEAIAAGRYQLFHQGEEAPLFTSTAGPLGPGDYIEFYGSKNRSELDRFLFRDPDAEMLNPGYSLFTDTSAYFLTIVPEGGQGWRYQQLENDLGNVPAKEEWFWGEDNRIFTNTLAQETFIEGASFSRFDRGEGFASPYRKNQNIELTPRYRVAAPVSSRFDVRLAARPRNDHQLRISIGNETVYDEEFFGFEMKVLAFEKSAAALSDRERLTIGGQKQGNDDYAVAQVRLTYPRAFHFEDKSSFSFQIEADDAPKYLEIEHFKSGTRNPVLYDLTNRQRLEARVDGELVKVHLSPSATNRDLILADPVAGVFTVDRVEPVSFSDYQRTTDAEYVIISNRKLYNDGNGRNWIQEYADYRRSPEGGAFRTEVVEVQELYDQFAYGVNRHPLAIRNFGHFIKKYWPRARYVLLIGKARQYNEIRTPAQLAADKNQSFFVPTLGYPGADNLLMASNDSQIPILAIGRIAAATAEDVRLYLDKLKEYEAGSHSGAEADRAWRKEIIHLGGGGSAGEQQTIRNALARMEQVIEGNAYGGNVFSFFKTSSEPIQQAQSELITGRINDGAAILTFFGHSGTGGFDFSLDDPSTYKNRGRYPIMFALGCLSGQIHLDFKSVGENFIFQNRSGAMAFIATVGFGTIPALEGVTREFYRLAASQDYGQGAGEILRKSFIPFNNSGNIFTAMLVEQYTLNGDPALVLTPFDDPDYLVDARTVTFLPEVINAQQEKFSLEFEIANIGKAVSDSLVVEVRRQFPDGSELVAIREKIAAPAYRQKMSFDIATLGRRAVGYNRFFINVDADNDIGESPEPPAEQNNELTGLDGQKGALVYIFDNAVAPLYPEAFGIVNSPQVTLKAAPANAFAKEQTYVFEIDTTEYFNSPLKQRDLITQTGGLLQWDPGLSLAGGVTYYWRVSPDSTAEFGYLWESSSFTYLPGSSEGWNQSHFFQFRKNQFENMEIPEGKRRLKFLDDVKTMQVGNGVYPDFFPGISINNTTFGYLPWDNPIRGGLYITVLDSITADPWINIPPGDYGSHVSPWAYWAAYPYRTRDTDNRALAINFLENVVPSGNYVLIYTVQHTTIDYEPQEWAGDSLTLGTNLFQVLEKQGARLIRRTATEGAKPYVLFYRKDDPSFPLYENLVERSETIEEVFSIPGRWDQGAVNSVTIGPASHWGHLQWAASEVEEKDEFNLDLTGIRADSTQAILAAGWPPVDTVLSDVDAGEYPYLRLTVNSLDTIRRSSPRLDYWRVTYEGLPDAMLNPLRWYAGLGDTLQQGQPARLEIAVENISQYPLDSLLVQYQLLDEKNNRTVFERRYRPLGPGDTLIAALDIDTRVLNGRQQLIVEANPDRDQPELYHFNNIGILEFYVGEDRQNPILDVTFDGIHIMNGDIISPRPRVVISLEDENQFLALADTALMKVLVRYPEANDVRPVSFSSGELQFYPAAPDATGKNRATIEWSPQFVQDGEYTLLVQGQDAAGNASGKFSYKVVFQVITDSRISNVFNYPNPFSTSTRFVYTLTGEEAPAFFLIQIMTVSGRVVRELTPEDLGPLRIGTHQTEYTWDGTDEFGDRLANGVYLYRVIAKDAVGEDLEKYDTGTDRFFKGEIGKLVILR